MQVLAMLRKETGIVDEGLLQKAINDNSNYSILQKGILSGDIALVDKQNKPVFRKSLTLIAEKGKRVVNESPHEDDLEDEMIEPEQARLRMQPSAVTDQYVEGVKDFVRRNSFVSPDPYF